MAARASAEEFDFDRMERIHQALLDRGPQHPGVHHFVGETYGLLKLPARALASFEQAARLPDAGPPTWMELASIYERTHRLDEAEELIERAVRAGYDRPLVWLVRGRIQRRQNRITEAEATLRALIERLPADSKWACQAWSELAFMKDLAGDFAGAMESIERCKASQRLHKERHWTASTKLHSRIHELLSGLTRDVLRRWRDQAADLVPARVALLTGFPRSGTTLLEQLLDAHPDLISSEERDFVGQYMLHHLVAHRGKTPLLEILSSREADEIAHYRRRYTQAMEYLLGSSIGSRMHLDKNPSYNLMLPLMLRLFPETRIIVALRDPRDVVLSCYLRYLPLNPVSVWFLDIRHTAEKYAIDMTAWLKLRELLDSPWCEVRYEEIVGDTQGQARKALAALDLPWDCQVLDYRDRLKGTKQVMSPSYEAVAEPVHTRSIGRWKKYAEQLAPALETLDPFVKEFGYA
jgi:tetratricopeptide (TPR) repeat protein